MTSLKIRPSAYKHGISAEDMCYVVENYIDYLFIEEEPDKILYIGYDTAQRKLEVVIVEFSDNVMYIIHAMKVRKSTLRLFQEVKNEQR
jgi:hypothetical protein